MEYTLMLSYILYIWRAMDDAYMECQLQSIQYPNELTVHLIDISRYISDVFMLLYVQVPMMDGINKTIEFFRNELQRKTHSERNIWHPDSGAFHNQLD